MKQPIIISLGGSLIVPDNVNVGFLRDFKKLILSHVEQGKKFVIITGGGKIARLYNEAEAKITTPTKDDLDWLGIAATRLNAELVRISFGDLAFEKVIIDPNNFPQTDKPIMLGGGWKPGNSSDLAAVQSAVSVNSSKLVNLSNIDYVYDKDPREYPDAKRIERISWAEFRKIIPSEWTPGGNWPFDPIAAKRAEELGLEVAIMNGVNLENLAHYFEGKPFKGTVIR